MAKDNTTPTRDGPGVHPDHRHGDPSAWALLPGYLRNYTRGRARRQIRGDQHDVRHEDLSDPTDPGI